MKQVKSDSPQRRAVFFKVVGGIIFIAVFLFTYGLVQAISHYFEWSQGVGFGSLIVILLGTAVITERLTKSIMKRRFPDEPQDSVPLDPDRQ